jgi:acetylornithine deacetylase/succinyl-diaminopimelate desuccinylase-like protein
MLDQTAAMAAVFKRCLTGDLRYPGDLVFLAVADEENGGRLGARWLVEEHWDAVATDYLLTEIGTPALVGRRGPGIPVTVAEKGPHWRRLHARGVPAHGSQPYATHNALVPLADAVTRLAAQPPGPHMSPEWLRFVSAWDPPVDLAADLVDPDRIDAAVARIAEYDLGLARWVHACTHLTVSPNLLRAGVKANIVPDRGVLEVDVRTVPGQDHVDVLEYFRATIGPAFDDLEYEVVESTPASGSPPEGPLWDALVDASEAVAPGRHLIPAMIPVGTDARFFRPRGTVAYGIGVFDERIGFGDFLRMFHGHDERVSEASLGLTTDLYAATVERLASLV